MQLESTPFTVQIVEAVDVAGAVRYVVEVVQPPRKWLLWKRYNEFLALHTSLTTQPTAQPLPAMPPKCYWPLGPDIPFLEQRRQALQQYLTALSSRPDLRALAPVQTFVAPPAASTEPNQLPQYFPDPPIQGVQTGPGSLAARVLTVGAAALRTLFVFVQSLEIDPTPAKLVAVHDSQRMAVATAVTALRSLLPELESAAAEQQNNAFYAECAMVVRAVELWNSTAVDAGEAAALQAALGDKQLVVRPLHWYEAQVAQVVADAADAHRDDERAAKLLSQLRDEMDHRSRAGQAASVSRLRTLCSKIETPRGAGTAAHVRSTLATPQAVLSMLQKRGRDLAANVAAAKEGVMPEELCARVDQLGSDVLSCRDELRAAGAATAQFAATQTALDQLLQLVADLRHQLRGPVAISVIPTDEAEAAAAVVAPTISDDVYKL